MHHSRLLWIATLIFVSTSKFARAQSAKFWNDQAQDTLETALYREASLNRNVAKNVVIFIGDGMGITTVTAARILKGQQAGMTGEESIMEWEKFSSVALSKTYNTDTQVPDSGGTSTAQFCGVKTKDGLIGLDSSAIRGNCRSSLNARVDSVMAGAEKSGKSTGFVTNTRVTHATPAALYAHAADRRWESDSRIPAEEAALGCTDIAHQLITIGKNTKVVLGGGRREMLPNNTADYEYPSEMGRRRDGRNLIDEWAASKDPQTSRFVWNLDQFNEVDPENTEYLMGLFETGHMHFETERLNDVGGEPSIAEMTEKAIKILQKDQDGFFLMVEGGRIDHGHHDGHAKTALIDTIALNDAVAKAMELTSEEDTLVVVTADHGHVMTIGGFPSRGYPILGSFLKGAVDNLPHTTLAYTNGPGGIEERNSYIGRGDRRNLTDEDTEHPTFLQPAIVPLMYETHSGEDVAIYANGPMSHLFHGVHEQNYIAHVVRYAACLDDTKRHCNSYELPCGVGGKGMTGGAPSGLVKGAFITYALFVNAFVVLTIVQP